MSLLCCTGLVWPLAGTRTQDAVLLPESSSFEPLRGYVLWVQETGLCVVVHAKRNHASLSPRLVWSWEVACYPLSCQLMSVRVWCEFGASSSVLSGKELQDCYPLSCTRVRLKSSEHGVWLSCPIQGVMLSSAIRDGRSHAGCKDFSGL